jgi:hypothetical protein
MTNGTSSQRPTDSEWEYTKDRKVRVRRRVDPEPDDLGEYQEQKPCPYCGLPQWKASGPSSRALPSDCDNAKCRERFEREERERIAETERSNRRMDRYIRQSDWLERNKLRLIGVGLLGISVLIFCCGKGDVKWWAGLPLIFAPSFLFSSGRR